tara:strand:- start:38 stop:229 length:192 start_codon:yes stop_codon:yes gene_type:complete
MESCECGKKLYGYSDGRHEVFICFSCGKFIGHANGDAEFATMVLTNPSSILGMIKEKYLRPHN